MYGVPRNIDLSSIQGSTLDHILVARHVICFGFESGTSLRVEGKWELTEPDGAVLDQSADLSKPVSERGPLRLHACVGQAVLVARPEPPKSIALEFEGGLTLRVFDDSKQYESFHIQPGDIHV